MTKRSSRAHMPGWLAVLFTRTTTLEERARAVRELGATFAEGFDGSQVMSFLRVPAGSEEQKVDEALQHSAISDAQLRFT